MYKIDRRGGGDPEIVYLDGPPFSANIVLSNNITFTISFWKLIFFQFWEKNDDIKSLFFLKCAQ